VLSRCLQASIAAGRVSQRQPIAVISAARKVRQADGLTGQERYQATTLSAVMLHAPMRTLI
jgi:hypothetical protein